MPYTTFTQFQAEMKRLNEIVYGKVVPMPSVKQQILFTIAEIGHLGWVYEILGKVPDKNYNEAYQSHEKEYAEFVEDFKNFYVFQVNQWKSLQHSNDTHNADGHPTDKDVKKLTEIQDWLKKRDFDRHN